jgi:hypothetical protein
MTQFYPLYPRFQAELLYGFRMLFGSAMVVSIALGLAAILRRDIARHRAWMIRGYAIGQGAGTQALTALLWLLVFGTPDDLTKELLMGASWAIKWLIADEFYDLPTWPHLALLAFPCITSRVPPELFGAGQPLLGKQRIHKEPDALGIQELLLSTERQRVVANNGDVADIALEHRVAGKTEAPGFVCLKIREVLATQVEHKVDWAVPAG